MADHSTLDNEHLCVLMEELAAQLQAAKGKKVYGYLPQTARNLVNNIVDELAKDEHIAKLYDLWYEQRAQIVHTYQNKEPERLPLSQNKTFHSLKNIVVKEMLDFTSGKPIELPEPDPEPEPAPPTFPAFIPPKYPLPASTDEAQPPPMEPEEAAPAPVFSAFRSKDKNFWWTDEYKRARSFLYGTKESSPDFDRAFLLMEAEAKKGNGLAMHDLGKMFLNALYGLGRLYLDKDFDGYEPARAIIFLKEAAAKDHSYAQYTLGKLLLQGEVTEKDIPEALALLAKAADAGNPFAQYLLGKTIIYHEEAIHDIPRGIQLPKDAAAQNNLYAHYTLGKVYTDESLGVMDSAKAIRHLEAAAKQSFSPAQYRLAKLYLGLGQTADALHWLEEAIQDGNQYAQYQLGRMLVFRQSVDKDVERGMALLEASAAQGNTYAQRIIDSYGKPPVTFVGLRLLASVSRLLQGRIQEDHKQMPQVDKKLRQKIAEKKQAQGLRMGKEDMKFETRRIFFASYFNFTSQIEIRKL